MSAAVARNRFREAERTLVSWWELQRPATVLQEYGEWFVEIDGERYSLSEQAFAIADGIKPWVVQATQRAFTAEQKRKVVERELKFRRRVYPKFIANGRMTQALADEQIAIMEAIRADYVAAEQAERLL